jgi:hypothetical protein
LCLLTTLCWPAVAWADGGTLRASQVLGDHRISIFTSPAVLGAGWIDVSVLLQDGKTGEILHDPGVQIRMECLDHATVPWEQAATSAAATNKLYRAAQFRLPVEGTWRCTATVGNGAALSAELQVAPPLPEWLAILPWIGWCWAVVALFAVHRVLVARSQSAFRTTRAIAPAGITASAKGGGVWKA